MGEVVSGRVRFEPARDTALTLTRAEMVAIYRAGMQRGSDEAVAFDWGSTASGTWDDGLHEEVCDIINAGMPWADEQRVRFDEIREWFRHPTPDIGS